ncbi:MAG: hypothetical protein H7Z43_01130 [Clostridia bacterium]|nr:hypothetical protein [Deltaproteobacteria bacterium]
MADNDKSARREAKELWDASRPQFAVGNYREVRRLDAVIAEKGRGSDIAAQAEKERQALGPDTTVLYVAAGVTLLYGLAWVYALV